MKMRQNRQCQHNLRAKAFGEALKKGIREDVMMRSCFQSDFSLDKHERKSRQKIEKLLNGDHKEELSDWQKQSHLRAQAWRKAFKEALLSGDDEEREELNRRKAQASLNALREGLKENIKTE